MSLRDYGWSDDLSKAFEGLQRPGLEPARVLLATSAKYRLITAAGERPGMLSGRLRHLAENASDLPAVGDWVALKPAGTGVSRIVAVLERRTKLSRKVSGKRTGEQIVAANVDVVFVVMGLDGDFSVRRLERLLTLTRESGARPVVVLNKLDICDEPGARRDEIERVAAGAPVVVCSCTDDEGMDAVRDQIRPRETAVLVGSSGVGKSTLINRLAGSVVQETGPVREADHRGRHTTTHRELFLLPGGGLLIDSPGIREVQLWSGEESLAQTFDDVTSLAAGCRYRDCSHETEAGCAILEALASGSLPSDRLESYRALNEELSHLERRRDESAQQAQKGKWRAIHRERRRFKNDRSR